MLPVTSVAWVNSLPDIGAKSKYLLPDIILSVGVIIVLLPASNSQLADESVLVSATTTLLILIITSLDVVVLALSKLYRCLGWKRLEPVSRITFAVLSNFNLFTRSSFCASLALLSVKSLPET